MTSFPLLPPVPDLPEDPVALKKKLVALLRKVPIKPALRHSQCELSEPLPTAAGVRQGGLSLRTRR